MAPHGRGRAVAGIAALLFLATLALFAPVAGHDFITYDDDIYITENPGVRSGLTATSLAWAFRDTGTGNWHPLTWASHQIDVTLFGLAPGAHHLVSAALHAACATVLFAALAGMTGAVWPSAFAAALFAVHPTHVEPVAWAAERKEVLSALLWSLALAAHLRHARRPRPATYIILAAACALALAAKATAATLPLCLLVLDVWPLGRLPRTPFARLLLEKAPLLAMSLAAGTAAYLAQHDAGAVSMRGAVHLAARAGHALDNAGAYLASAFWPAGLMLPYPYTPAAPGWRGIAAPLAVVLGVSAVAWRARRSAPQLAAGWAWYLVSIAPVSGLVQAGGQGMADRYAYVPHVGLFVGLSWSARGIVANRRRVRAACAAGACATLVALGTASARQLEHWRDGVALFGHAVRVSPGNWIAHHQLGLALERRGADDEAAASYREALRINPRHARSRLGLGAALNRRGRPDLALEEFTAAIRLLPENAAARYNRGNSLLSLGRLEDAAADYAEALRLRPGYDMAANNLGVALLRLGRAQEAAAMFRRALAANPGNATAARNLAEVAGAVPRAGGDPDPQPTGVGDARLDP